METSPNQPLDSWLKRWNPKLPLDGAKEALRLLSEGAPAAYIAKAKADLLGGLDLKTIHELQDKRVEWEELERRRKQIAKEIEQQGKMSEELKTNLERTFDLERLEDLFIPYRSKKQTLGVQAREAGLGVLADYLWKSGHGEPVDEISGETLLDKAKQFVKADTRYADPEGVLKGVLDILVEKIAEAPELRSHVRNAVFRRSKLKCSKGSKAKPNSKFTKYFNYQEPIGSLKKSGSGYRYLMIRKAWMEDELSVSFERPDEGVLLEEFEKFACTNKESIGAELLLQAARLALKGNVYTAVENEAHRNLREGAEVALTQSIAEAFRHKILRPPFGNRAVLAIVPVGIDENQVAHMVFLDSAGKLILQVAQKVSETNEAWEDDLIKSLNNLKIELVIVSHGPGFTKIREIFKKVFQKSGHAIPLISVHEPISSIYSSCPAGKEDFPDLDNSARKAAFLGRYVQDPLAALVRLDFKFFVINELQHEIAHPIMRQAFHRVLEECIAFLGVDLNHAPISLISRVPGIGVDLAKAIVAERENKGKFASLADIKRVAGITERALELSDGFFVIHNGASSLEAFPLTTKVRSALEAPLKALNWSPENLTEEMQKALEDNAELKSAVGEHTLKAAIQALAHGKTDPRGEFILHQPEADLWTLADLKKDRSYDGIVTNVTTFGVFVDLGLDQDGLIHISQLPMESARNLFDTFFPSSRITVWVSQVNEEKKQISLALRNPADRPAPRKRQHQPRGEKRDARPPRRRPQEGVDPNAAAPQDAESTDRAQQPRNFRGKRREARGDRPEQKDRKDRKPKAPKKPSRDPKTGAVVRHDDEYKHSGPRLPSRAQPTTFNPFANLADILKNKEGAKE